MTLDNKSKIDNHIQRDLAIYALTYMILNSKNENKFDELTLGILFSESDIIGRK